MKVAGKISATALLVVTSLCLLWSALGLRILIRGYENDFLCFYIGGTLARERRFGDLYNAQAQAGTQQRVAPGLAVQRPYPRPPWFALAIAPITALPLAQAYAVWIGVLLVTLVATWVWGAARFGENGLVLAALWPATNLGIFYGQDAVLMLAACCAAYSLLDRKRSFLSGLVLGMGLMKFHLLLLVPVWLIFQKRWRMLAGFSATGAVFVAAAVATLGISGLAEYLRYLRFGNTEIGRSPEYMINVYSVLTTLKVESKIAYGLSAAGILVIAIIGMRRAPAWRAIAIALTSSLLVTPHDFLYDAGMLLLPVWLTMKYTKCGFSKLGVLLLANPLLVYLFWTRAEWRCLNAVVLLFFFIAMVLDRTTEEHSHGIAVPA